MTDFLPRILETKREEVSQLKSQSIDLSALSNLPPCRGFQSSIRRAAGLAVVAEFKKASPSKGPIAPELDSVTMASAYERGGASAISVLTDTRYFQGSLQDLRDIRAHVNLPVLRKDFIIDELQIAEARLAGADAVLLIVAALEPNRLVELSAYAQSIGLDVLIEVHALSELDAALKANPSVLGVNNRNLHTFEVDLNTTRDVIRETPKGQLVIAESGVHSAEDAQLMLSYGARGILVGESLMRTGHPEDAAQKVQELCGVTAKLEQRSVSG
jgi:indole-3-glycerol phosphate synthase